MPYKANTPHRHKIPKARYKIENWREYDAAPGLWPTLTADRRIAALPGHPAPPGPQLMFLGGLRPTGTGDEAKFDKLTPEQLTDPTFVATIPIVRAPVIRALCLGEWEDVRVHGKGVRIIGADIKGDCQGNTH